MHKKGKIGRLGFGSSSVKYINLKKVPFGKGKIMEVCEIKKMIIMNTCNYLNYVLL
jgi:hypothetical protein